MVQVDADGLVTYEQMLEFEKGLWHVHLQCMQDLVVTEARVERHPWKKLEVTPLNLTLTSIGSSRLPRQ